MNDDEEEEKKGPFKSGRDGADAVTFHSNFYSRPPIKVKKQRKRYDENETEDDNENNHKSTLNLLQPLLAKKDKKRRRWMSPPRKSFAKNHQRTWSGANDNPEGGDSDLERAWYTADDDDGVHDVNARDDAAWKSREVQLLRRVQRNTPRQPRTNIREAHRNREQDLWEMNRLTQSGVRDSSLIPGPPTEESFYTLPTTGAACTGDTATHVVVVERRPPFLDQQTTYQANQGPVVVLRDPTADMAILAKKGSLVVRKLREQEEKGRNRQKFWEIKGSTMGNAVGLGEADKTQQEQREEAEAARDFRASDNTQFAALIKDAQSEGQTEFTKSKSIAEQRRSLPICTVKDELRKLLLDHQIIVVIGETGSGKTTQLTQYLHEWNFTQHGVVACTQPRRVAAVSVAKRVADEMGVELGKEVGYAIRFEDCTSKETILQYMTDGILLRESLTDSHLDKFSAVVMDEAHERSLNTDILFGVLRDVAARRRDFRLIVTSATMDAKKFSKFFGNCETFTIPGRTFPVRIEYLRSPPDDYVDAAVQKCLQVHCSLSAGDQEHEQGDILIFMTGQEDIEACCSLIAERGAKLGDKVAPLSILPIYSTLPSELQAKIFRSAGSGIRKVIVATNIAETSLTLDGVRYVIDSGFCKLKVFSPRIGMHFLQVVPISQASALQRSGRAGRTGPGVCYRLYTERAYIAEMFASTVPEIQRTNLCHTVLLLKSIGVRDLLDFAFMDAPPQATLLSSLYQLWVLGALDDSANLTELGKRMVLFPLDPPLSKLLLQAAQKQCVSEAVVIVSMLSVPPVFYRPKDLAEEADVAHEKFAVVESDHLTLLNCFLQWNNHRRAPAWAAAHFLHQKGLMKSREVRGQLSEILEQQGIEETSIGPSGWDTVREVICSGYFHNAARLRGVGEYVSLRNATPAHLHPSSALFAAGASPEYVVFHEAVLTTREYMQTVTAVEPLWLATYGSVFFQLRTSGEGN